MSTIFSTVLIASPPAFLAGWLLSKALFRQLALQRSLIDAGKPANAVASVVSATASGQIDQAAVKKVLAERQQAQQQINQLREQLGVAQQRLQPLQGEVQLLKEAVAEREHHVLDLRQKLKVQGTPPEVDVRAATDSDTTRNRQLLQAMRDRLAAEEQLVSKQADQLSGVQKRLQSTMRRAHKWRLRFKPFLRQLRQQRAMINELREELRQRDLRQQQFDTVQPHKPVARSLEQSLAEQPASVPAAVDSRSDYSSINQEDLQLLRGLGPALHKKLNESGIYRLGQLAAISVDEYYRMSRSLGVAQKTAVRNDWPACARQLLAMEPVHPDAQPDSQQKAHADREN
jgi:predicted flap endonuclease-1-like 5' DNA nuclease